MEKFNTAMTVLMIVIMLVQLIINIAMLSKRSADAIKKLIATWTVPLMVLMMFSSGAFLVGHFLMTDAPRKLNYFALAAGFGAIAMSYGYLGYYILRQRILRLESYAHAVSDHFTHPSESSDEGSGG